MNQRLLLVAESQLVHLQAAETGIQTGTACAHELVLARDSLNWAARIAELKKANARGQAKRLQDAHALRVHAVKADQPAREVDRPNSSPWSVVLLES